MQVYRRVTPIKFAGTHLYTWVERGTVRVKCLAQEHGTMSPARARLRSARSGVERTNHEATAPPLSHPIQGGVEILQVASCYRNLDKLRPDGPLGSYADLTVVFYHIISYSSFRPSLCWKALSGKILKQTFKKD